MKSTMKSKDKKKRIAILTRAGFLYHLQVGWGFFEAIERSQESLDWRPILFFCKEADERVMFEQMEEIRLNNYDMIISIGSLRARIASQYIKDRDWEIPHVFCGVTDPKGLGIVDSFRAKKNLTGIYREQIGLYRSFEILKKIYPKMQSILLPYRKSAEDGLLEKKLINLQQKLNDVGVHATLFPASSARDYPEDLSRLIPQFDVVWSTEGNFIENFYQDIIELCNEHKTVFFANNLDIAKDGAAITLGADVRRIGAVLFEIVYQHLVDNIPLMKIPVIQIPNNRKIIVNTDACRKQGLKIDPRILMCLKIGLFVNDCT